MLSMYLGKMEEAVYYPPVYFDNRYEDEWITDKQSVEIIRDVDKSDVVSAHLIESPVLGPISPKELSGGVKTVLLMLFDETGRIFNACIRFLFLRKSSIILYYPLILYLLLVLDYLQAKFLYL